MKKLSKIVFYSFIGILTYPCSLVFAMEPQESDSWQVGFPIQSHPPLTASKNSVSVPVAAKFCEHYPTLRCEAVENKWVFHVDGMSDNLIKQFQINLDFFLQNPSIPLENIHCCFENYTPKNESQQGLINWAKTLLSYKGPKTCGLFISGSVGVGKTHISLAIAKECQQAGEKALFIQPQEIFQKAVLV